MADPTITVWTLPACVQCTSTKRFLEKHNLPYVEHSLTDHPEQAEQFRNAGHTTAPIVTTPLGTWAGFQYAKLHQLTEEQQ